MSRRLLPPPQPEAMMEGASRVLIAADFDGTLCPIANSPDTIQVTDGTIGVLRDIAACPDLTLAIISGRALADVRKYLPVDAIFAGNHGLQIAGRGLSFEHAEARRLRPALAGACVSLARLRERWPGAWVEDKGVTATLHFRAVDRGQHDAVIHAARKTLRGLTDRLALFSGKCSLEVRPRVAWDKGAALRYIREHAGPFERCICVGDDLTDEAMFLANADRFNIRVGWDPHTAATYCVADSRDVTRLLSHIVNLRRQKREPAGTSMQRAGAQ